MSRIVLIALLACALVSGVAAGRFLAGKKDDCDKGGKTYSSKQYHGKGSSGRDHNRVRVMSYNIFHAVGQDKLLNLTRTAQVIRNQKVDIVGLQEVDNAYSSRSNYTQEAKELAALLGWNYFYAANLNLTRLADTPPQFASRQYGTAILTRFQILETKNTFLSKLLPTAEQRGLAQAKLRINDEHVWFFNTHLSAAGFSNGENGTTERTTQVLEVINLVKNTTKGGRTPFIMTGDFNARPDQFETQPLFTNFTDAWPAANGPDGGFTIDVANPTRRIDYIFTNMMTKHSPFKVEEVYVPSDNLTLMTSDHRPVMGQLKMRN